MVIRFAEVAEELLVIIWSMIFSFSGFLWPGMFFVESSAISGSGGSGSSLIGGGSFGFWSLYPKSNVAIVVAVTAMAGIALAATFAYSHSGSLKSPWSRRRRKHALLSKQWKSFFTADGRLFDGGIKFLKKVRSGGVDPSIRAEVWPFLLGLYDVESSKEERDIIRMQRRKEYYNLREQCQRTIHEHTSGEVIYSKSNLPISNPNNSLSLFEEETRPETILSEEVKSASSSCSEEATVPESTVPESTHRKTNGVAKIPEGFDTWRKIIRLDAVRANSEWVRHSPSQAAVSEMEARWMAENVGLKEVEQLDPCRAFHAARLVAILEAYALHDPEIGYCQGMSDLLSPVISVMDDDSDAFFCFVNFMKRARHNFRLDEKGIKRQLGMVSKIIRFKDSNLYNHLEKLRAEDCFFVYRMVVVLFRRELSFEQTLCLWEVMWADQAAIRCGFGTSMLWARTRPKAPPTDDLLLYAIAACVLQMRKVIIERNNSMEEIMKECNCMAGNLDVWKLLDDAHELVLTLHEKV